VSGDGFRSVGRSRDSAVRPRLRVPGATGGAMAGVRSWYADWRVFLAAAFTLTVVWGVESWRKGDVMWFWPVVPLVMWALLAVGAVLVRKAVRRAG
jgi:hypothetical protein